MPAEITLDDVAAMARADEHHRYELSREGVLSIMPPATPEHALIVSRLTHWFFLHGYFAERESVALTWLLNEAVPNLG